MGMRRAPEPAVHSSSPVRGAVIDIVLNAAIPFLLYRLSKRYISPSEITALVIATTFPLAKSAFSLVRSRKLDPVALVVLAGIAVSGAVLFLGGNARILLIRESLFTGLFGCACFVSLLFPRPLMFYFGRYFMAGKDPEKRARFEMGWTLPELRFGHRLITAVWGVVYLGEFILRIICVYTLPAATVLLISPILVGSLTVATLLWTFRYGRRLRERGQAAFAQTGRPPSRT